MSEIRGTLVDLKDFLFKVNTKVNVEYNGQKMSVFNFEADRVLVVPDYQREIRWERENLLDLIKDIFDSQKFLGNIIVASCGDRKYEIIDGQQRLVMLTMIVNYIKNEYGEQISDIKELVDIQLNCFEKSSEFIKNKYCLTGLSEENIKTIVESDKYKQIDGLSDLYEAIKTSGFLSNASDARKVIENLENCQMNVVISNDNDRRSSTRYYLDVNLKGVKLDVEDIFKGYIFSQDTSDIIREKWVKLKTAWFKFNGNCSNKRTKKSLYPLMKIISHYFYSNVFSKDEYSKIEINDNFLINSDCKINGTNYHEGDHLVKAINNNTIIRRALDDITEFVNFMSDIIAVDGVSSKIKALFNNKIDDIEVKIFVNFIKKILLDKKLIIPKSLILKYYFEVLKNNPTKDTLKYMYAIYMYDGLFILFGDTNRPEAILAALKHQQFYSELIKAIKEYLTVLKLQNTKYKAIITATTNTEKEDMQFKCKTLATIYNFFKIDNDKVIVSGDIDKLDEFLSDSKKFSVEHFIINKSKKIEYVLKNGQKGLFIMPNIIQPYNNYIFNFIFIDKDVNEKMENFSLPNKLTTLKNVTINCEYSKMIISNLSELELGTFDNCFDSIDTEAEKQLNAYWKSRFSEVYDEYVKKVINSLVDRFNVL